MCGGVQKITIAIKYLSCISFRIYNIYLYMSNPTRRFETRRIATLFLVVFAFAARAQWQNVASNLIGFGPYKNGGAMCSSKGIAWAGLYNLYKSTDQGLTWSKVSFPLPTSSAITCIAFHDAMTGIVCTNKGAYITQDQGLSWRQLLPDNFYVATFSGSAADFVLGNSTDGMAYFTRDGGVTWTKTKLGSIP